LLSFCQIDRLQPRHFGLSDEGSSDSPPRRPAPASAAAQAVVQPISLVASLARDPARSGVARLAGGARGAPKPEPPTSQTYLSKFPPFYPITEIDHILPHPRSIDPLKPNNSATASTENVEAHASNPPGFVHASTQNLPTAQPATGAETSLPPALAFLDSTPTSLLALYSSLTLAPPGPSQCQPSKLQELMKQLLAPPKASPHDVSKSPPELLEQPTISSNSLSHQPETTSHKKCKKTKGRTKKKTGRGKQMNESHERRRVRINGWTAINDILGKGKENKKKKNLTLKRQVSILTVRPTGTSLKLGF